MAAVICELLEYIYVLFFGEYVCIRIACGEMNPKMRRVFYSICPLLLLLQGVLLSLTDTQTVRMFYPLITHLPTIAVLTLLLRAGWDVSIIAVVISYSMCQLLRWVGLFLGVVIPSAVGAAVAHLLLSHLILLFLKAHCLHYLYNILRDSSRMLRVFAGGMPSIYYLYDYFLLYTQLRYDQVPILRELLPTTMVAFYILFVCLHQYEAQRHRQAKEQTVMLEAELMQAEHEIGALRMIQEKTAIYRHDLRHHLRMINNLLQAGKISEVQNYIGGAEHEIESIVPVRYCEHDTINLLLGGIVSNAERKGIEIRVNASIPKSLALPNTELCVLLSNGMENALHATAATPEGTEKTIDFFCAIRQNNLLIEIRNPYCGEILIKEGMPCAKEDEHGFGWRSMVYIVQRRNGICSFDTEKNVFFLRIAIPLRDAA